MKKQIKNTETKEMTVSDLAKEMVAANSILNKKIDDFGENFDKKIDHLGHLIESLAIATKKGFDQVHLRIDVFQQETSDNFAKVRRDIMGIYDNYATKEEVGKISYRVKILEGKKN
jgi:hypothetical protein